MLTFAELKKLIEENNIPENVILCSDSGWEGGPTDMDGVHYSALFNEIIFTQGIEKHYSKGYKALK